MAANSATLGYDDLRYRLWYHDAVDDALRSTNLDLTNLQTVSVPSSFGLFTVDTINQTIYYLNTEKQVKSLDFNGNVSQDVLPVSNDTQDLQIDANNR